jgi:hypothetical protein
MAGDSTYQVNSHDWPLLTHSGIPISAVFRVLAAFDIFHSQAVQALAGTAVPAEAAQTATEELSNVDVAKTR